MPWPTPKRRQRVLGPSDARAPVRRSRHGLSADEIDALVAAQGGGCAICGRTDRVLQIDHDHRHCPGPIGCRRCVRGALCPGCNTGLAMLGESLDRVRRLATYLEQRGSA